MAKRRGRVPPARNAARSRPASSEGRKPVDQLFSSWSRTSFRKLTWILPDSPRDSSVKWIHWPGAAVHAEETLMKAKIRAPMNARQRFMIVSFEFEGKACPFARARRFKNSVLGVSSVGQFRASRIVAACPDLLGR